MYFRPLLYGGVLHCSATVHAIQSPQAAIRGVGRMLLPFELRMGTRQGCPLSLLLGDMEQSLKETMDTIVFFREVFWLQNNKSPLMPLDEDLWQHGDSVGDIPIVTSFLYLGIWVTP